MTQQAQQVHDANKRLGQALGLLGVIHSPEWQSRVDGPVQRLKDAGAGEDVITQAVHAAAAAAVRVAGMILSMDMPEDKRRRDVAWREAAALSAMAVVAGRLIGKNPADCFDETALAQTCSMDMDIMIAARQAVGLHTDGKNQGDIRFLQMIQTVADRFAPVPEPQPEPMPKEEVVPPKVEPVVLEPEPKVIPSPKPEPKVVEITPKPEPKPNVEVKAAPKIITPAPAENIPPAAGNNKNINNNKLSEQAPDKDNLPEIMIYIRDHWQEWEKFGDIFVGEDGQTQITLTALSTGGFNVANATAFSVCFNNRPEDYLLRHKNNKFAKRTPSGQAITLRPEIARMLKDQNKT
jgi:hypothetical protein